MSTKRPKVIFDTNSCRDQRAHTNFFGFRSDLEKFNEVADILFPKIVIDEIWNQKHKFLVSERAAFVKNSFMTLLDIKSEAVDTFDMSSHIAKLLESEAIDYTVVEVQDPAQAFAKIYKWAIANHPPFEAENDKGFKDAYIACVVDETLAACRDEYIFLCTKDVRLRQLYEGHPRVRLVRDYAEFEQYSFGSFVDSYLLEKICGELHVESGSCTVTDGWLNIEDNWVIAIDVADYNAMVVVDSGAREILGSSIVGTQEYVDALCHSSSFRATHETVMDLTGVTTYLSSDQMLSIIEAAVTNDQIYWLSADDDVRECLVPIFQHVKHMLDSEVKRKFEEHYGVKDD